MEFYTLWAGRHREVVAAKGEVQLGRADYPYPQLPGNSPHVIVGQSRDAPAEMVRTGYPVVNSCDLPPWTETEQPYRKCPVTRGDLIRDERRGYAVRCASPTDEPMGKGALVLVEGADDRESLYEAVGESSWLLGRGVTVPQWAMSAFRVPTSWWVLPTGATLRLHRADAAVALATACLRQTGPSRPYLSATFDGSKLVLKLIQPAEDSSAPPARSASQTRRRLWPHWLRFRAKG